MPRKKTMTSEELIRTADEYLLENPGKEFKIPDFGSYLRKKGYSIEDYTIRRDIGFRKYLEAYRNGVREKQHRAIITYKTMDVDAFLLKNHSREELKKALIIRDDYYRQIAAGASMAEKEKNLAKEKMREAQIRVEELELKMEAMQADIDNVEIRKRDATIIKMKKILDDYLYPDVANGILSQDGILEVVNKAVTSEKIRENLITADTDLSKMFCPSDISDPIETTKDKDMKESQFDCINDMLGGFDD